MNMKRIIFRCKTNTGTQDTVLEDYEFDLYIYTTIRSLQQQTSKNLVVAMHPQVLDFIKTCEFNHLTSETINGECKYKIYGQRIIITSDCMLRVLIDPMGDDGVHDASGCILV